jgi:dephospho-CoA kinase
LELIPEVVTYKPAPTAIIHTGGSMSAWPGKYVIGLTGNIATGKSVVRKMLEHLGAYGIDADALSHRAMAQGAPAYQPILDTFGRWILAPDGQIDRSRLGRVVFSDPQALQRLEDIIHPLVRQAVDILIRRSTQQVIVLEAIKLLESPLRQNCDTVIVTCAPQSIQIARLIQKRGMSEEAARQRIAAQPPQEQKIAAAAHVIQNEGSFEDTWRQVDATWQAIFHGRPEAPAPVTAVPKGELVVERGRPRQASEIADLITRLSGNAIHMTRNDIMAGFGEKAYLLLRLDNRLVGVVGWQVENLVARTDEVYLEKTIPFSTALKLAFEEIERASRDLQCEVSLLFLSNTIARYAETWHALGYEQRRVEDLGVRAWQEAARESMPPGTVLMFKQLRKDRVLRPV